MPKTKIKIQDCVAPKGRKGTVMLLWVELCDIIDTIEKWYEDGFSSDIPDDVKDKVSDLYECCLSYKNEN